MTTAVSPSVGKGKNKTYDPYTLRKSAKPPWGNPVVYFFSLLLVALCVGPVLYIIIGGFRTNSQITRDPAGWPDPWNFENYKTVFTSNIFWSELVNSLIVSIGTMVGVVVLALMVSFVIARYEFKFNKLLYSLFAAGMMFPHHRGHHQVSGHRHRPLWPAGRGGHRVRNTRHRVRALHPEASGARPELRRCEGIRCDYGKNSTGKCEEEVR